MNKKLLNAVNKVTSYHIHGNEIPKDVLDNLANVQLEYEKELNIKVGDFLTVKKWTSHTDNSYIGDVLEVIEVFLPHFTVRRYTKNSTNIIRLSLNAVEIEELPQGYIDSVLMDNKL